MNDSQCDFPLNTMLLPTLCNNREECEANILLQVANLPWQCQAKRTNQVKKNSILLLEMFGLQFLIYFKWYNS